MNSIAVLEKLQKLQVQYSTDYTFSQLTTFGTGGKIAVVAFPQTCRQLVKTLRFLRRNNVRFVVLGRGSNVLASDDFFDGVVVCTRRFCKVFAVGKKVICTGGTLTSRLFALCCKKHLSGTEFLSCIPATVGGAITMNAGCFCEETSKIVKRVVALSPSGKIVNFSQKRCLFDKRQSIFQQGYIVLFAVLKLKRKSESEIRQKAKQLHYLKALSQPLDKKSAGCVFYSPTCAVSALIDKAGLKGFTVGGAQISKKHAGFVVNIDKATSKDIYLVLVNIYNALLSQFGVRAQTEIQLINFDGVQDDFFTKR